MVHCKHIKCLDYEYDSVKKTKKYNFEFDGSNTIKISGMNKKHLEEHYVTIVLIGNMSIRWVIKEHFREAEFLKSKIDICLSVKIGMWDFRNTISE